MAALYVDIPSSFELPTDADWDQLDNEYMSNLTIDLSKFDSYRDSLLLYPRIEECVTGYNNKIGSLQITYVLCKHYYDLGIPDEPWYVSPSPDGKSSVKYDPNFKPEHYMRRFWFNHFAENLYVTVFGAWDSIIELLNMFYDINAVTDYRLRSNVMKWLKENKIEIYNLLNSLQHNSIYTKANGFRTQFVHGFAPSQVSNQNKYEKDTTATILDSQASAMSGKVVYKEVQHATVMSLGVGDYTPVREVIEKFEQFSLLTASQKDELIDLMVNQ